MTEARKGIPDPLVESEAPLGYRMSVLAKTYFGAILNNLEDLDLDKHFFMLKIIGSHDLITQQCLANCLDIDKASIVRMIDYLSEKGLVTRETNPNDRREHIIKPTRKGKRYATRIHEAYLALNNDAFAGFTKAERKAYLEMSSRLLINLKALPAKDYELTYTKKK